MDNPEAVPPAEQAPPTTALAFARSIVPFIPTYLHLFVAALIPIVCGAHAALSRPHSTLSPAARKKLLTESEKLDIDSEEEEEEPAPAVESLGVTDALMFPVTAGLMLSLLYVIIKWLEDPSILSKIMTFYFGFVGAFAIAKTYADALNVCISYLFPNEYKDRKTGEVYKAGYSSYRSESGKESGSPVPFYMPQAVWEHLWELRRSARARWQLVANVRGVKGSIKKSFSLGTIIGLLVGPVTVAIYAMGGKHWTFSNIMGIAFCYGAVQFMSATTFPIATLLLGLLFFYDIFFVFYTPLMVTVATNLDVPIKLMFPRPGTTKDGHQQLAMLGLGDIVIPGMVITMALKYDLWRHYEKKRRALLSAAREVAKEQKKPLPTQEDETTIKPRYEKPHGWGERMWMNEGRPFPKPYFYASLTGWIVGMLATLIVMHVFKHAQPALLYLVPGVLSGIWGMAAYHGELKVLWGYSEEGDEDRIEREKKEKEEKEAAEKKKKEAKGKKDSGKQEKEEKPKKPVGEKAMQEYVNISIIRRAAPGAAALETKEKAKPVLAVPDEQSEDDMGSESGSSSGVEVPREGMWGTTVLGEEK